MCRDFATVQSPYFCVLVIGDKLLFSQKKYYLCSYQLIKEEYGLFLAYCPCV